MKKFKLFGLLALTFSLISCGNNKDNKSEFKVDSISIDGCTSSCEVNYGDEYNLDISLVKEDYNNVVSLIVNGTEYRISGDNKFKIDEEDGDVVIPFIGSEIVEKEYIVETIKYSDSNNEIKEMYVNKSVSVSIVPPYKKINAETVISKINNGESFLLYIGSESSSGYISLLETLKNYKLNNNNEVIYYLSIEQDENDNYTDNTLTTDVLNEITKGYDTFIDSLSIPLISSYSNGSVIDVVTGDNMTVEDIEEISRNYKKDLFSSLVNKEVKNIECVNDEYTLTDSILSVHKLTLEDDSIVYAIDALGSGLHNGIRLVTILDLETNKFLKIKIVDHNETNGKGADVLESQEYLNYFVGLDITYWIDSTGDNSDITTGASTTSKGIDRIMTDIARMFVSLEDEYKVDFKGEYIVEQGSAITQISSSELSSMTSGTYILFLTSEGCSSCVKFKTIVENYIKKTNQKVYEILLRDFRAQYTFDGFAPSLVIINDGEIVGIMPNEGINIAIELECPEVINKYLTNDLLSATTR